MAKSNKTENPVVENNIEDSQVMKEKKVKKVKKETSDISEVKSKKKKVPQELVEVPKTLEVPETSEVLVPEPKSKKSKKKKVRQESVEVSVVIPVEEVPVEEVPVEEVPVETPVIVPSSTETTDEGSEFCDDKFNENKQKTDEILKNLIIVVQSRISSDKDLLTSLRELNRQVIRERKEVEKVVKKMNKGHRKKRKGGNKSPGGFTKPAPLSVMMCNFLNVSEGTELARTEVTRRVNAYVKNNNLQNPSNKKQIIPDENLKSLLNLQDTDELTYFNLQRYMKGHFLKALVQEEKS
jgi:chromatin remodeling complex protein RSC6